MSLVLIIAGPTASGKSARALDVAAARNGVIINADSIQIFDALPVLSARPTPEEMAAAPHALYAALAPEKPVTAELWRGMACAAIDKALEDNKLPVICGGTGFYIKALTDGLSPLPEIPRTFRQEAESLLASMGHEAFHAALAKRDPETAARLHPNDTHRIVRAWEVLDATGTGLAAWQARKPEKSPYAFEIELLLPEREELRARIDSRFDAMMGTGALDEAAAFDEQVKSGVVPADAAVTHAHGFRPLQAHLRDQITLAEAVDLSKTETKQYAKRQTTWFRHQL